MKNLTSYTTTVFFTVLMLFINCNSSGQKVSSTEEFSIQIDGSKQFQKMDGFGVNINTAWWIDGDFRSTDIVKPAIDLLCDELRATIFRAVIEDIDWETTNDNNDPDTFNWNFYDSIFTTKRFLGTWNTLSYLNRKGITNDLVISLMGSPPASKPLAKLQSADSWMGDTTHIINPEMEDEFVESIAALLFYARNKAKIQFSLVSPMNESDIISATKSKEHPNGIVEGPNIPDATQFNRILKKLAKKLDAIGMNDIRFVVPDAGGERLFKDCFNEMVKDDYLMGKLAHWGVHDYGDNADNYLKIVSQPENTNKSFWVTETARIGNIFGQLDDNPTSLIFWDGFDCVYQHARRNGYGNIPPNDWVFWFGEKEGKPLIEYNAASQTWKPRKQFYEFAQLFRFVEPGATRISVTSEKNNPPLYAFINPGNKLALVGINKSKSPVTVNGRLSNLSEVKSFEFFYTDSLNDLKKLTDISVSDSSFSVTIPAGVVFTLAEKTTRLKPEPTGWYAGDMHVHRDCGGPVEGILQENRFIEMMEVNDLAVISVLADMGDAEVKPSETDLPKINGKDYHLSVPGRTIHYDAEWHWDPYGTTFEHKALGGHVVLLGMKEAQKIWDESPYKILEYGRKQNGIVGFCHTEYLNDTIQNNLNCCIPVEYPVEAALGTTDFFSEDVYGSISQNNGNYNADATINAYYKLLNCGIRLGLCAGTDYPCNSSEPLGTLLTYVQVEGPFTYRKWVEGIRDGKTVVARNGHEEFIDLKVNGKYQPGDEIKFKNNGDVAVEIKWTSIKPLTGSLELVYNGKVVASQKGTAKPGEPIVLKSNQEFTKSGWLCARRMNENGHQAHTAPVYVTVNNKPVRASAADALYFVKMIENLIEKTSPEQEWNHYFTHSLDVVQGRYKKAKDYYLKVAEEARTASK